MLILLAVFFALLQPCGPLFAQGQDDTPPDAVGQLPALVTSLLDED
ncbi:MAG: hypothetical protein GX131_13490 [candidate division WS1 bacterium]|nr:hypothetical protein [candidate division WS1 bacterium]